MDFRRRRPSPDAIAWVEAQVGRGARVTSWRRLTGGLGSAVHRLAVSTPTGRTSVVLRQYDEGPWAGQAIELEAAMLRAVTPLGRTPRLLAASADGVDVDGHASLLMTVVPGRVDLDPADPARWVRDVAAAAAEIHALGVTAPPFERWTDVTALQTPTGAKPDVWRAMRQALQTEPPKSTSDVFIHRDLQHFNLLWSRGRLTGIVDWTYASRGQAAHDVGHCRLNLAVLHGADRAELLRHAYEAETGAPLDPWWDLLSSASYTDDWPRFIPFQVAGRMEVDTAGMTARVEDHIARILRRL